VLFHGGNGFASNAHDFHRVVLIRLVSDGRFGQERPALYQAGNRICELGSTRIATLAFAGPQSARFGVEETEQIKTKAVSMRAFQDTGTARMQGAG
jgi:hypothetical protein